MEVRPGAGTWRCQSSKDQVCLRLEALHRERVVSPDVSDFWERRSLRPGSPYYDNVRPLSYPDSDAVLICFDISRPETLDSVLKKASAGE
ncbi:hypothetical protein P7K49_014116 [Saguinus oedipus]|uniref:Uncharacterized protein n=1 Tax=Saguinus oedipus TaxID=9490 RepID=A0ABQ9VII4_SAGOE|nr:hypothetical protein P7K49_014116 [Saguinus oedipus]